MNLPMDRDFLAQGAIVLAACVGAWMLLVKPKVDELATLEQTIAQSKASAAPMTQEMFENLGKKMGPIRERLAQIESFNELAADSSRFYGAVMELAKEHGVQVQSLRPGSAMQSTADNQVSVKRIDMAVEGTYENVSSFLDSIKGLNAFLRPVSLQLVPVRVEGKALVNATFGCELLSFSPEATPAPSAGAAGTPAAAGGVANAQS